MSRMRSTTFDDGLRVASFDIKHARSVSLRILVNTGSRDEGDGETGMAHMLEHMAFKGTRGRTARDIALEVENVGGRMNAYTDREHTAYYLRLLSEHLDLGTDILCDILTSSTMPKPEVERERGVIIQEIGEALDDPGDVAFEMFAKAAHGTHQLARPVLGTVESVRNFTRDQIKGFMTRHYGPGRMIVAAAGAVDHDRLVRGIRERLKGLGRVDAPMRGAPQWRAGRCVDVRESEMSHVFFGLPCMANRDNRRFALGLFSSMLGGGASSRLFQEVRERRGLCYQVYCQSSLLSDAGVFSLYGGTSHDRVNEMIRVMAEQMRDLANRVDPDELDRAKTRFRASMAMSQDSVTKRSGALASQLVIHDRLIDDEEILGEVDAVGADDVRDVASGMMEAGGPALAVLGQSADVMENECLGRLLGAG